MDKTRQNKIIHKLVWLIIGATITFIATRVLESMFPPVPQAVMQGQEHASHFGKLRKDYPPFIYTFRFTGCMPEKKGGLFGIGGRAPIWWYALSFANLSMTELQNVYVTVNIRDFKGKAYAIMGAETKTNDGRIRSEQENIEFPSSLRFTGTLSKLRVGTSYTIPIAVISRDKPHLNDFGITVESTNGVFVEIDYQQWLNVGWQSKKPTAAP